jgi:hypothetical protein
MKNRIPDFLTNILKYTSFLILIFCFGACNSPHVIYLQKDADKLLQLAAKEIKRYVYLRTGEILTISDSDSTKAMFLFKQDRKLEQDEFMLESNGTQLVITGGADISILYGAYEFAEQLGVRFYLHGDVIPDEKIPFKLPILKIHKSPAFEKRGILPFHDFAEGPDWWDEADYKTVFTQMVKMKMNFAGFHTYPEQNAHEELWYRAEPLVWIGKKESVAENGYVNEAYPTMHFSTGNTEWGYRCTPTSQFVGGASLLFEKVGYGLSYMDNVSPWPHYNNENLKIFNESGVFFNNVFSFAKNYGIQLCVGTETPLTIPNQVKEKYQIKKETESDIRQFYEGIFTRIVKTYPVDYYWLWNPEYWTWSCDKVYDEEVMKTLRDIQIANEVLNKMGKPMQLATCGWVLGPPKERTMFDRILPTEIPFSCMNRGQGYSPVDSGFNQIKERPKWSIPWVEDDPDLISSQLWVGRLQKNAFDSYNYGCNGLMGVHWRTKDLAPNFSALAKASWNNKEWFSQQNSAREFLPNDFYTDWVKSEFGANHLYLIQLFTELDGKGIARGEGAYGDAPLKATEWENGPGAIFSKQWDNLSKKRVQLKVYDFIPTLEDYRKNIAGAGNLDRFDYWLNSFKFNRQLVHLGMAKIEFDSLIKEVEIQNIPDDQLAIHKKVLLEKRVNLASEWNELIRYLLLKTSTKGDMGIIANLEMHNLNYNQFLTEHDVLLEELMGKELPKDVFPSKSYSGPLRIVVTPAPSVLFKGVEYNLQIRVLSKSENISCKMHYRNLGERVYTSRSLRAISKNVFEVDINDTIFDNDFEYYFEVNAGNETVCYPATAKNVNHSIVIVNR